MALTDDNKVVDNVIDLNIEGIKRTRFKINKDPSAILELNISDLNIGQRLVKGYEDFEKELTKMGKLSEDDESFYKKLAESDKKMRESLDYIFDSNVSEICGKGGTMYDIKDGMFRFEAICDALTKLYDENLNNEFKKMKARVQKHLDSFQPQDHKKPTKRKENK